MVVETEMENVENQNEIKKRDRIKSDSSDIKSDGDINSPDAKKVRNDHDEVMETIDVIDKDMEVVYLTRVISQLDIETDDINIKKLIDCYNPVLRGDIDMMKRHMLDVSESWIDKEKSFKMAISYVVNDENEILETNIGDLAESLIAAIENRMPTFCKDCENWYTVGRKNKPRMFCTWCKVGMHNCKKVNGIEELKGIRWFCNVCIDLFTEQIQPKLSRSKNIIFKGFEEKNKELKNATKEVNLTNKKEDPKDRKDNDDIIVLDDKSEDSKKNEKKDTENESDELENRNEMEKANKKETKIECWFWINRRCKYGDKCRNYHPEQCKIMMESGRCPDHRCKLSHPKICRSLYNDGYCSRKNCWYTHPTKIKNKYTNAENNNQGAYMMNNNINQQGWNQGNMGTSSQWNQNNNSSSQWNQNNSDFLGQWPTPSEASRPMKMMLGKIMTEIATRFMNM